MLFMLRHAVCLSCGARDQRGIVGLTIFPSVILGKRALVASGATAPGDCLPACDCGDYRGEDLPSTDF